MGLGLRLREVAVLEALHHGLAMALHSLEVGGQHSLEGVEGHIADVVITVQEKPTQNVRVRASVGQRWGWGRILFVGVMVVLTVVSGLRIAPRAGSGGLPRMLMASTRSPLSDSMAMMVCTHSYRIALPAFLEVSVLVATWVGLVS